MSAYPWIDPANPPFPTAMNLPFQFSAGIQSSTLMLESAEGLSTIVTRQCRGSDGGAGAPPGAPRPVGAAAPRPAAGAAPRAAPGCTEGPAWTNSALAIVACGVERDRRLSHGVAPTAVARSVRLRAANIVDLLEIQISGRFATRTGARGIFLTPDDRTRRAERRADYRVK